MSRKKRILIVNEFSQLMTGFSTYMYYLLPRLYNTDKYEIAELGVYSSQFHPKINDTPWKVYPNEPDPRNQSEVNAYNADRINQFGKFKFDEVCLDFQPDVVIDIRDIWMCQWMERSPYRNNFKLIHMTTCDGEPQKQEWLDFFGTCDVLMTYSLWAKNLLERQSNGKLKVSTFAPACPDLDVFKPAQDKKVLRRQFGLEEDLMLFQTVMRNQPRKLYPDLMKAFSKYLSLCEASGNHELAKKSFLYCHTTYPDLGWDLPTELRKHKLSHKVLFTYMCDHCGAVYPSFWNGEISVCRNCQKEHARLPHTAIGVDRETLGKIMSVADLYIQYSVCEGQGMPICDAKACGIPVACVDYSAMSEQTRNGGGLTIPVKRMFQEPVGQTNQLRSLPDNDAAAQIMFDFASAPQEYRDKLSKEARECVEKYYNWDSVAKIWEDVIDKLAVEPIQQRWLKPFSPIVPEMRMPNNLDNTQFVHWCYTNILHEPEKINSSIAQKTIAALNAGYELGQDGEGKPVKIPVDRNKLIQHMFGYVQQYNQYDQLRFERLVLKKDHKKELVFGEI